VEESTLGDVREGNVADEVRRLLDTIMKRWVLRTEMRAVELDASASESGREIVSDQMETMRREENRADELAPAFAQGLARAWRRAKLGEDELLLDDRDPEQNRIADALIGFLVSYDLAASRSIETDENHYIYAITIDWSHLGDIAQVAGIDLFPALDRLMEHTTR
jgi:hypothetical protein